jgi:rod shape-determining protein MreD
VRLVKLLAGIALALAIHLVGTRLFPGFSRWVDVFLVAVVLYALSGKTLSALLVGLGVGLLEDSLANGPLGLFGFADTLVAYGTARLAQRLVIQRATGVLLVVSFASLLQQAILALLAFMLLPNPSLAAPLGMALHAALQAGACGLVGMTAYGAARNWSRTAEARRRGRMGRLRLE